jgi:hypothetical protein
LRRFVPQKSRLSGLREPKVRRTFGSWRTPGATWSLQGKKPPDRRFFGDFMREAQQTPGY